MITKQKLLLHFVSFNLPSSGKCIKMPIGRKKWIICLFLIVLTSFVHDLYVLTLLTLSHNYFVPMKKKSGFVHLRVSLFKKINSYCCDLNLENFEILIKEKWKKNNRVRILITDN